MGVHLTATVLLSNPPLRTPSISEGLSVNPSWPSGRIGGIRLARLGGIVSYEVYNVQHTATAGRYPIKDPASGTGRQEICPAFLIRKYLGTQFRYGKLSL